jgi:hypothetical protein
MGTYVRVGRIGNQSLYTLQATQASIELRLASQGPPTAGHLLPAVSCRTYKREHYAANRQRYIANAHKRKQAIALERAALLVEFFRERPCVDCGESDPMVLEFDHLGEKSFNIAKGLRTHSWQAVLDEIAKCEVVCANCHRRRTAHRGGFARAAVAQR